MRMMMNDDDDDDGNDDEDDDDDDDDDRESHIQRRVLAQMTSLSAVLTSFKDSNVLRQLLNLNTKSKVLDLESKLS